MSDSISDPMEAWFVSVCGTLGIASTSQPVAGAAVAAAAAPTWRRGAAQAAGTEAPPAPAPVEAAEVTERAAEAEAPAPSAAAESTVVSPAAGPGAREQADAAEAATSALQVVLDKVKLVETELEAIVEDAEQAARDAAAARTEADASILAIGTPPELSTPDGDAAKARYDASIRITGTLRQAQAGAADRAASARTQQVALTTAVDVAGVQHDAAADRVRIAKERRDEATRIAKTAAEHAKRSLTAAQKSKAAAQKAADTDPGFASLQKQAKADAGHAARAKAAATKAVGFAKDAAAGVVQVQQSAGAAAEARDAARADADRLDRCLVGLEAELEPFGARIAQAEEQEAGCRAKLSEADALAILQRRYEALGGDPELRKALAAEDAAVRTQIETFRAKAEDFKLDRDRELGRQMERVEATLQAARADVATSRTWHEREDGVLWDHVRRANVLGDKLKTEPGKELLLTLRGTMDLVIEVGRTLEQNELLIEKTEAMRAALRELFADARENHLAANQFADAKGTELDNEIESRAMTLEDKVNYLQARPKDVRERIASELDGRLDVIRAGMLADARAEDALLLEEPEPTHRAPIDWTDIRTQLDEVEGTELEVLRGADPVLVALEKEYEAAGGDAALLKRRVAAWKQQVAERVQTDKERSDRYREVSEKLQRQVEDAAERVDKSREAVASIADVIERAEERLAVLSSADEMTEQEIFEQTKLHREVSRKENELEARTQLLEGQESTQANAEKLRDQHEERYESTHGEDASPTLEKPSSSDIHELPIRAKFTELTGKEAT